MDASPLTRWRAAVLEGLLRKWILSCDDHGVARGDLTDGQWARLEPLLPVGKKAGRPRTWTRRQLIDGIRWRTRADTPWRDIPERYGPCGPGLRPVAISGALYDRPGGGCDGRCQSAGVTAEGALFHSAPVQRGEGRARVVAGSRARPPRGLRVSSSPEVPA
ncbi:transposase [Kitasatospora sp. NPDC017646]|uniref:transposase n=1 Tax=Kitasatospora sp. NPDC017646 TaxID=3364024 RepID=UPI00378A1D36